MVSLYDVASAADLSYPNVDLCTSGFKENYSCGTYAQGSCPSGYVAVANTNKFLEVYNNTCQSGYNKQTLPSAIIAYQPPLSHMFYPNVDLCTSGFKENYSCGTYAQGSCPSGYVGLANTNKFLEVYNNTCQSGYNKQTLPSAIIAYQSPLSRMFYPNVNVCSNGVTSNYACSNRVQGVCPDYYYDAKLPDSAFAFQTNSVCPSGYTSYPYAEKLNDQYGLFGNGTIVDVSWLNWGGTELASSTCVYGGFVSAPDVTPTQVDGLTFLGWRPIQQSQQQGE